MGVTIRHYFNTMHAGKGRHWTWAVTVILFVIDRVAVDRSGCGRDL